MAKTLAALYKDTHTAQQVFEALLETGFSGDDISLIVKDAKVAVDTPDKFSTTDGASLGALVGALVGIGSALVPGIGRLIGSGPLAVAVTAGIGAATGALTGGISASLIEFDLDEVETQQHETAQREAGTVVSVTSNEEWLEWAYKIMARHHPITIRRARCQMVYERLGIVFRFGDSGAITGCQCKPSRLAEKFLDQTHEARTNLP